MKIGLSLRSRAMRVSVMLSTLIAGLDGRSNFERNGGALDPSSTFPSPTFSTTASIGIRQILRSQFHGGGICHLSFCWVARPYDLWRANI